MLFFAILYSAVAIGGVITIYLMGKTQTHENKNKKDNLNKDRSLGETRDLF